MVCLKNLRKGFTFLCTRTTLYLLSPTTRSPYAETLFHQKKIICQKGIMQTCCSINWQDNFHYCAMCRSAVSFLEKTSHCDTEVGEANGLLRTVANQTLPPVEETYCTVARGCRSPAPKLDLAIARHFKPAITRHL